MRPNPANLAAPFSKCLPLQVPFIPFILFILSSETVSLEMKKRTPARFGFPDLRRQGDCQIRQILPDRLLLPNSYAKF
jgi:hypothetical protein